MGGDDGLIISARFCFWEERCLVAFWRVGKVSRRPLLVTAHLDLFWLLAYGVPRPESLSAGERKHEFPF